MLNSPKQSVIKSSRLFGRVLRYIKNNKKKIIIGIVILVVLVRIGERFAPRDETIIAQTPVVVEAFNIGQLDATSLEASCIVQAVTDVDVVAQVGGNVIRVNKQDGDSVKEGEVIFEIENTSERVSVADANASLQSARFALEELLEDNNSTDESSLLAQTIQQQETLIENAKNDYFNTDLRAYPQDNPENTRGGAPIISGNYTCEEEGEYLIEVYSSAAKSGASFRFSGLESGTAVVANGSFSSFLGNCGLEIVFPEDFSRSEDWIIPVPNKRSSQFVSVKNTYQNAIESKNITLNQVSASPQRIAQEQSRVEQARLRYQLAIENLNKKIIRATATGVLGGFSIDAGQFVGSNESVGQIKTVDQLELVTFVDPKEQRFIKLGADAEVKEISTKVTQVARTTDISTQKIKVTLAPPAEINLLEGTQTSCSIERETDATIVSDGGVVVPLSAISIIGVDAFVFKITESGMVEKFPVETGAILGKSVALYGIDDSVTIVLDARGLREGDKVEVK